MSTRTPAAGQSRRRLASDESNMQTLFQILPLAPAMSPACSALTAAYLGNDQGERTRNSPPSSKKRSPSRIRPASAATARSAKTVRTASALSRAAGTACRLSASWRWRNTTEDQPHEPPRPHHRHDRNRRRVQRHKDHDGGSIDYVIRLAARNEFRRACSASSTRTRSRGSA